MREFEIDEPWYKVPFFGNLVYEHIADKAKQTANNYRRFANEFVEFCCHRWECEPQELDFAKCTLIEIEKGRVVRTPIRTEVIKDFLSQISNSSPRFTANTILFILFRYYVQEGVLTTNPVPKPPPQPWNHRKGLSYTQIEELASSILTLKEPFKTAFVIMLSSGARAPEICAMRFSDIQQTESGDWTVAICREAQKGRRAAKLPLPDVSEVISLYLKWREENGITSEYLFTDRKGKVLDYTRLYRATIPIKLQGFTGNVTPHLLRHAYATLMDKFAENPDAVVQAMRHQTSFAHDRTTRGYVHKADQDEVKEWISNLPVVQLGESLAALWLTMRRD